MNISAINSTVLPDPASRTAGAESAQGSSRPVAAEPANNAGAAQTTQPVAAAQKTDVTRAQLEEAVKAANDFINPINNSIEFSLDHDTGVTVVKVIDVATKDVIRQMPSEEMLSITKAIDKVKGLLVQQKA